MSDRADMDRLTEALDQIGGPAGKSWGGDHFLVRREVVDAARLLANGQRVEWCKEHEATFNGLARPPRCRYWIQAVMHEPEILISPCRIVSMLLVNPEEGEI